MIHCTTNFQRSWVFLHCQTLEDRATPTNTPLPDLGRGFYQGFQAGLYPNGSAIPPAGHLADGLAIAQNQIQPLNSLGQPDANNGRIVMVSIGMSNTTQEFGSTPNSFKVRADQDNSRNPRLVIVDGAQGGQAADAWVDPAAPTWAALQQRLTNANVTAQQVQVAWIKQADRQPYQYGAFPAHAQHLQSELEAIVHNLKSLYPNIRIAYVSSRTMSYDNTPTDLNPEPFAYESGFATQWMIAKQIAGDASLNYDPGAGTVVAPFLSWGPYLWADGTNPRSDGFTWLQSDLKADLTHPSDAGVLKVSDQLLSFFKTDPTATPWFLQSVVVGQPPTANPTADVMSGMAPLAVNFTAQAQDADGAIRETAWTFDDGTFSKSATPVKIFKNPGTYNVHLAVVDNSGNPITRTVTIQVEPGPMTAATQINNGSAQRSMVTKLTTTFTDEPTFPEGFAAAFQLQRIGPGNPTGPVVLAFSQNGNAVTMSFDDPVYAPGSTKSLIDGRYVLTLVASKIMGGGMLFDGDDNGIPGGDGLLEFHRLFGDIDGNAAINSIDFAAFRTVFGTNGWLFDISGDGVVGSEDFAEFRKRFGISISP